MAQSLAPNASPEAAYAALQASLAPAPALSPKQAHLLALLDQERDNRLSIALLNAYNGAPPPLPCKSTASLERSRLTRPPDSIPAPRRRVPGPYARRPRSRGCRVASCPRTPRRARGRRARGPRRRPRAERRSSPR
jgi:hypothetical protein